MPHVLRVPALELRDPIAIAVLPVADDPGLHVQSVAAVRIVRAGTSPRATPRVE